MSTPSPQSGARTRAPHRRPAPLPARPARPGSPRSRRGVAPLARPLLSGVRPALLLLVLALSAACGYQQDVPRLPGDARTIALREVSNLTSTGELDVRLRAQLEHRLAQQAHLRVAAPAQATLLLSVRLESLTVSRALDPAVASQRSLIHTLNGHVTLRDRSSGRKFLDDEAVSVSVQRLHDPAVVETPAIRDEALDDTLAAFAAEVERRLFRTF